MENPLNQFSNDGSSIPKQNSKSFASGITAE